MPMPADQIERNWGWIGQLLRPSIAMGIARSEQRVRAMLNDGRMGLASIHVPNGAGLITLEPGEYDGVPALWVPYIYASVKAGPKVWIRTMIDVLAHFETKAREAGLQEVRIGGRDWSFLPGYEPFDGVLNGRKKVL